MSKKKVKTFREYDEAHIHAILNRVGKYTVIKAPNTRKEWAIQLKDSKLLME